jgi:hypothetical protein
MKAWALQQPQVGQNGEQAPPWCDSDASSGQGSGPGNPGRSTKPNCGPTQASTSRSATNRFTYGVYTNGVVGIEELAGSATRSTRVRPYRR